MTRETIEREIARLDTLSRSRSLDDGESLQLGRLVAIERRYNGMRVAVRVPKAERRKPAPGLPRTIIEKLDATIARMGRDGLSIRAIYLTEADLAALKAIVAQDAREGGPPLSYRGLPVRLTKSDAKASIIYSIHGIARSVWVGPR